MISLILKFIFSRGSVSSILTNIKQLVIRRIVQIIVSEKNANRFFVPVLIGMSSSIRWAKTPILKLVYVTS